MNSLSSTIAPGSSGLNTNSPQLSPPGWQSHHTHGAKAVADTPASLSPLPRSKILQQFVSNLFQALEQNQQFIAERLQRQQEGDATASAQFQDNNLGVEPPLLEELQQLITQLNDQDGPHHGAPPFRQLQSLYQTTPWHEAYPNLPLGLLLQDLSQQLGVEPLQTRSRLGQFVDTQI
ncbi:MAG: hypothetical protein ACRCRW_11790 [Aeromonadaceae bacterium]